jgi:phosphoglycolate phosphatase
MYGMTTRHVIWDWNGTLLDDVWLCVEVLNGMLAHHSLPAVSADRYREVFSFPVVKVYRAMGFDTSAKEFEKTSYEYIAAYEMRRMECNLQIGALETLSAFKRAGIAQSILSAYRQDMLDSIIREKGIEEYFERLAGNTNIFAASKVEYGRTLVADLGVPKGAIVMIGDTEHDYEVASELGIRCILVSCGHSSRERLLKLGAPVVDAVADVVRLVNPPRGAASQLSAVCREKVE